MNKTNAGELANYEILTIVVSILVGISLWSSFNNSVPAKAIFYGLGALFGLAAVGIFTKLKYKMLTR